jgi:hypothetical protein
MVEVRILLTILYGNGGAEQRRLMDLRRQTQPQAVAQRLAGGVGESVSPTAPRWGVWGEEIEYELFSLKVMKEE